MSEGIKIIVNNKKAFHEYEVMDRLVAGLVLLGTEVKSLRLGKANLNEAWIDLKNHEAFLVSSHIGHYTHGNIANHLETRPRKLLLKHKEILKLEESMFQKGLTIIPLKLFFKRSLVKIEIALARGKKHYDKRESAKKHSAERDMQRALNKR